jgi:thioredoxin reductase
MQNVVIIGSGCAGLTAAIYAARANLKPLVIDGHEPGGQLSLTTHVENFPGFPDGIMGPELIENMRKQAQRFGAEFKAGVISEVDLTKRPFKITAGKDTYEAQSLIVAAGASARLLVCQMSVNSSAMVFRPAPPAMAISSAIARSRLSAVATQLWKRQISCRATRAAYI